MTAMRVNAELSFNQELGCQQFDICQVRKSPNSILLYEVYDDEPAFEAHKLASHNHTFKQVINSMVVHKSVRLLTLDSQNREG